MSTAEREAEASRILGWVCGRLFDTAPQGWRRLDLKVTMASTVDDIVHTAVMEDGSTPVHEPPMEIRAAFADVRELLYEPGLGTWFSIRLVLDPPDFYRVNVNYDVDPVWDPPVDVRVLEEDLKAYPRSEENIPPWLRKALAAGTGTTAQGGTA
jgi:hypothetical protein